ncbi:GDSL family lipase [Frankia sp. AgB1.9]|uniref:GDSL-type esterase/lipase family protein n=1 Tax=unclassified Frankia TaxID=2632575 RepID=UPI00193260DF|nr:MULTISPECIES: GDSL-type esterase/lipase family protein [unclassified Frankia]MBL7493428.1 GDSL family lipase [Frankia sp. AgW1.1]MBL7549053.1 GDSL family lipase [Frankia sp. AgB1.9]MBL7624302.1 GDSL family lipase [Frankia sp. AgB1.8]
MGEVGRGFSLRRWRPTALRATVVGLAVAVTAAACGGSGAAGGKTSPGSRTRIMIIGDSLAQGTAGDYTWRYRLAGHLTLTAPGRVDLVGDRTDLYDPLTDDAGSHAYLDPKFDTDHHADWRDAFRLEIPKVAGLLRKVPADVLLVELGENDLTYWTKPAETVALTKQFIDNARKANPNITIVLGHVLTRWDYLRDDLGLPIATDYNRLLDAQVPRWSTPTSKVVLALTDQGWDPQKDTWDGTHPNPDGEMLIARGFANALHSLGIGGPFGPVYGGLTWPEKGGTPTATPAGGTRYTLSWPAAAGTDDFIVERRISSANEASFTRLPGSVKGTSWTTDSLPAGATVAYRIIPLKFWMAGQPGPAVEFAVPGQ